MKRKNFPGKKRERRTIALNNLTNNIEEYKHKLNLNQNELNQLKSKKFVIDDGVKEFYGLFGMTISSSEIKRLIKDTLLRIKSQTSESINRSIKEKEILEHRI